MPLTNMPSVVGNDNMAIVHTDTTKINLKVLHNLAELRENITLRITIKKRVL